MLFVIAIQASLQW